jgi:acyl carrier protein
MCHNVLGVYMNENDVVFLKIKELVFEFTENNIQDIDLENISLKKDLCFTSIDTMVFLVRLSEDFNFKIDNIGEVLSKYGSVDNLKNIYNLVRDSRS